MQAPRTARGNPRTHPCMPISKDQTADNDHNLERINLQTSKSPCPEVFALMLSCKTLCYDLRPLLYKSVYFKLDITSVINVRRRLRCERSMDSPDFLKRCQDVHLTVTCDGLESLSQRSRNLLLLRDYDSAIRMYLSGRVHYSTTFEQSKIRFWSVFILSRLLANLYVFRFKDTLEDSCHLKSFKFDLDLRRVDKALRRNFEDEMDQMRRETPGSSLRNEFAIARRMLSRFSALRI